MLNNKWRDTYRCSMHLGNVKISTKMIMINLTKHSQPASQIPVEEINIQRVIMQSLHATTKISV